MMDQSIGLERAMCGPLYYVHTIDKKHRYDKDGRNVEILIEYLTMLECCAWSWCSSAIVLSACVELGNADEYVTE